MRYAVVGGGLLGMTLALRLRQAGNDVTLFEAAPHLGGLAACWQLGDITWDKHYHVTLRSDRFLRQILDELQLESEMRWVETKTGFYTDGALHSLSNTVEFLRFPPLRMLDKMRLGATILYASRIKSAGSLEAVPVADWLRRFSGRRTYEKLWRPLLRAKLGTNDEIASAAFIWATIARMYAARRTGMKRELFGYVPGGYARILEAFGSKLRRLGVDIRLGARVSKVTGSQGGVAIVSGDPETFDRAIATVHAPLILELCPDLSETEKNALRKVRYQGIVCASLLLRRGLSPYYVTNITESAPFSAVIEMSAVVDPAFLGGHHLVYLPKYVPSDDAAFERSDEQIRAEFIGALVNMYPAFAPQDVLAFRISRVRHVLPIATLNYSQAVLPHRTSIPNLFIANSTQIINGTLNVNETVQLAEAAATELLSAA
ncbi:MAG: NAD(P)/FAD-dependent oxidoreductase [Candidatus Eremiobacteraeota bacterium]|nr:NAD(P)/FAD-dependent oxidoreductase [Candidatus Eremiobacteraeota bacterium]